MNAHWIYEGNDNEVRFLLGEKGHKTLICIGINPSYAKPENLDRTICSVKKIALNSGYDSWLMINVYPQRATKPNDLAKEINQDYHCENLKQIKSIFDNNSCDIWAAWGTLINKRKYLFSCLKDIVSLAKDYSNNWYSFGKLTKHGHPHHPLFLSHSLKLDRFDIENYIKTK
ncbi:MAG TPA: DUF1643 domain-containing protein [Spirochaetota bacterium]|jgi:hypothetical protein|nr:DUF1643 domain-containing protein [Spirochaetota bacterium]